MQEPAIGFFRIIVARRGTARTAARSRLPHNNNRGAALPLSTIPVLSVRGHRPLLFYAAVLYSEIT